MKSLLYIIAVILVIGWAISVIAYSIGGLIHILILLAIISLVIGLLRGSSSTTTV
ncbi:lmo0937 family membrane protein [Mucilaginibacter terrae]|uniref:lmo0937 family membrane protein n=1 Tax=Mucilaginibacter terrae TaxID=1955052 RepID=UPI003644AD0B